jgi:hypothetical protein
MPNDVFGIMPDDVKAASSADFLMNLQEAKFHNSAFIGSLLSKMGHLSMLENLWAFGNMIKGVILSEIGLLKHLMDLQLNVNLLDASIPSEIGLLNLLTSLDLSTNLLSGKKLHELGLLMYLVDLDLSACTLTGSILNSFGELMGLGEIDRCDIVSSVSENLSCEKPYCSPLKQFSGGLRLHNNRLGGTIPSLLFCLETSWQHLALLNARSQ